MKTNKGTAAAISPKMIILALVVLGAVVIGALMMMGPKLSLQTPPIEPKAMSYLQEHKFLHADEQIAGYKAISYYNYDNAAVITNKRVFIYDKDKVFSIPLDKISMVVLKDSELGQQEVMISAQAQGFIGFSVAHKAVPLLIELLQVPRSMVKDASSDANTAKSTTKSS